MLHQGVNVECVLARGADLQPALKLGGSSERLMAPF